MTNPDPVRLPTEHDVANKLAYLARTDEEYAHKKTRLEGLKLAEKVVLAQAYLDCNAGSASEANAVKYNQKIYKDWKQDYENAMIDFVLIQEARDRAKTVISFWQSLNKARSQGAHI